MLEKTIIESSIFCNFSRIYNQLNSVNTLQQQHQQQQTLEPAKKESTIREDIMATTIKFKTIFYSIFQASNPMLVQKSVRHVNKYSDVDSTEYRLKREKNNESVRKSRAKNRDKLVECSTNVNQLKSENIQLNKKLEGLQNELYTLKNLFQHCFSFNINSLPFKPSDIPTSTLHKIIMQNKALETPTPVAVGVDLQATSKINDVDNYFIAQMKNAMSSIVRKDEAMVNPVEK